MSTRHPWDIPLLLFSTPGPLELTLIFLVVLLLFGAKKLPEIGRALGEGIREFKKSITDMGKGKEDKNKS